MELLGDYDPHLGGVVTALNSFQLLVILLSLCVHVYRFQVSSLQGVVADVAPTVEVVVVVLQDLILLQERVLDLAHILVVVRFSFLILIS